VTLRRGQRHPVATGASEALGRGGGAGEHLEGPDGVERLHSRESDDEYVSLGHAASLNAPEPGVNDTFPTDSAIPTIPTIPTKPGHGPGGGPFKAGKPGADTELSW
jgi:hypothetical protein